MSEISKRELIHFDWEENVSRYKNIYENIRNGIISDIQNEEEENEIKFQINDINMYIPPLHIGINKENLEYSWKTLRSKVSTKVFSNSGIYNIQMTLLFPRETLLELHRLIIQIRNNPFICIKNRYLSSSLSTTDYFQVFKFNNTAMSGSMMKSTHFVVTNMQCVNYQASPGSFLVELDLRIFNTSPYSADLKYRHDLFYLLGADKLSTIDAFFSGVTVDTKNPLLYSDRILENVTKIANAPIQNTTVESTDNNEGNFKKNSIYAYEINEKIPSFGVEYPFESCIFVRYYNYLQAKHLYLNFNIDIQDELVKYFSSIAIKISNENKNFKGYHDFFNIGLLNINTNTSYRVLSLASKYMPLKLRNFVSDKMLEDDDTFTLLYETYITLNLDEKLLNKIRQIICDGVRFDITEDPQAKAEQKTKLENNIANFKEKINAATDTGFTVSIYDYRSPIDAGDLINVELDLEEIKKIKGYIFSTSSLDFVPDFSAFIERRLNVFSTVEVVNLAASPTEDRAELVKLLLLKPLVVTSCSAMLTNSVATIPIIGHTYPTYQYLGSHEPIYQLTFAANSFGNDPEILDDLPVGIKTIETFRYEMEHNIQNFKQIPNSHAFSLKCFITKLFDSYRISDVNIINRESKGELKEEEAKNSTPESSRLIKKRLSINAINTQTLEGSPGTTVGSLRFSETNNFDIESLQLVYNEGYSNLDGYAQKIYKVATDYCEGKEIKIEESNLSDEDKIKKLTDEINSRLKQGDTLVNIIKNNDSFFENPSDTFTTYDFELNITSGTGEDEYKNVFSDIDFNFAKFIGEFNEEETFFYFREPEDYEEERKNNESLNTFNSIKTKIKNKTKLTNDEKNIDNFLKAICNFKYLASSLLIEPEYYMFSDNNDNKELVVNEKKRLNNLFYGIFNFHGDDSKPSIYPMYMRYMRYLLISSDMDNENFNKAIDSSKLKEILTKKTDFYNKKTDFGAYADVWAGWGAIGTAISFKSIIVGLITSVAGGFAHSKAYDARLEDGIVNGAVDTNKQRVFLTLNQFKKQLDKGAYELSEKEKEHVKEMFNLDSYLDSNTIAYYVTKMVQDSLAYDLYVRTSAKDSLADIASTFTTKVLNTNPIFKLYSNDILNQNLVNAIILPDSTTSKVNKLLFNGFEQRIFSYLFWFPKQQDKTLGLDLISEDLKFYHHIFKHNNDSNFSLRLNHNSKNLYQDLNDNLRNLMINSEWSLLYQKLNKDNVKTTIQNNISESDNIILNETIIENFKNERDSSNKDYLVLICKKDTELRKAIKNAQDNRIAYLENLFNELIVGALHEQSIINIMTSIINAENANPDEENELKFFNSLNNEVNGLDVSNSNCYPDIDLPMRPLAFDNEKLNPGFFYFDNNKELFLPQEIAIRKKKDRDIAESLLKKSYTFMQELRKGDVYSGNSSWNFINDEAGKPNKERKTFVITNTNPDNSETKQSIVTFQDSTMTDYQEGGMLLEKINKDLSSTDDDPENYIYTAPKITFLLEDEDPEETVIYNPNSDLNVDVIKETRTNAISSNDTNRIKTYEIKEDAKNLNESIEIDILKSNDAGDGNQESSIVAGDMLMPIINGQTKEDDFVPDFANAGLFYQSNFNLLEEHETNEISDDKLDQYRNFLKNSLYGDGEQSMVGILDNLENSMSFLNRRTVSQMYPTFKFYIVEEDAFESDNPLVFDDFYSFNAIKDITIYKNRKLPADTAVVRLQNVSGSIDGSKPTGLRDIDYDMLGVDESNSNQIGMQNNAMNLNSVLLRPGVTTQIRLGYESNPNKLEVMLSGKITDINWSSNGDMCEIVIQSFGTELLGKKIGTKEDGISDTFTFNNTDSVLKFMIHQSDLKHFGKFKKGYTSKFLQDPNLRKLEISMGRPRSSEVSWMDTIRNLYSNYGFYATIGIGLTASVLTVVALKFPKVGATIAKIVNTSGRFLYTSKFVTAITLFSNKLFFRGFGLSDDVIAAAATSIISGGKTGLSKIGILRQLFSPTWLEWFAKGTRFRDLSAKIGYNNAVYRLIGLAENTADPILKGTAGGALNFIASKGAVSIIASSFLGTVFKTYLGINVLNYGISLSATAVSGMLDAFSSTFSFLSSSQSEYAETKAKLKLAFSKDEIIYSPMDDCIYPPYPSTYILSNKALKKAGDTNGNVIFSFDEDGGNEKEGLSAKFSHSIRNILAETFNTITDIFLRSWFFAQVIDIPVGLLSLRFTSSPHYLDAETRLTGDIGSPYDLFPALEDTNHFVELTKNPYAIADKRLYEVVDENKYQIFNKTTWEIFEEMALRHPGWVTTTRPYGLGTEYRVFFGLPSDKIYKRELSLATRERLSKILGHYFTIDADGKINKENPNLNEKQIIELLPLKYQRYIKELSKKIDSDTARVKLKQTAESLMIKDCLETTKSRYSMLRNYHYLNSDMNIVSCNISLNDKAPNTVNVNYLHTFDASQRVNDPSEYKRIYTRKMQAHPYIPDDAMNEISWNESNPDTIQCKGYGAALRYGMSLLINGAKEMYDGEIITIGNPNINPFDIVLIEDKVNGISGPVEVEAVTHMFSFETGYLTEIKPNALVTGNEAMTYSITSTAPVFLATEQVVKRLSRRNYLVEKNDDGTRKIDDETRAEIKSILDSYFKKPDFQGRDLFIDRRQPNFWYDFVAKNGFDKAININNIQNTQLDRVITQINEAVLENIIKALSENKIDVLVNMKQGLFQIPEAITQSINQVSSDIITVGSISGIVAAATEVLSRRASVDLISRGWVVNMLASIKNSGKLGAMIAIGGILFGDKIESTIEEFISNESTLNNILNLTQETRFAKINDGTLLHVFPLYKNEKALLGASFQFIRQNEIWHNRVGQIYNDVSDAALGYLQMRKQLQTTQDFSGEIKKIIDNQSTFKKAKIYLYNRYMKMNQEEKDGIKPEIEKEVILSNTSPTSLLNSN